MFCTSHGRPTPPARFAALALRPVPDLPPDARAVAAGHRVAVIDGSNAFQLAPLVAMAKVCRVAPERFLRRVHVVRAFTCWQFTTLLCEGLQLLLASRSIGLVVLLDPLTHFLDENVTFKKARLLFDRVLRRMRALMQHGRCS